MYRNLSEYQPEPPHPGEILREDILPCLSMTRTALARHLGVSVRLLGDLLAERRSVDRAMAQRLGAAFGHGARYWLGLQVQYDLWHSDYDGPPAVSPLTWGKRAVARPSRRKAARTYAA
jgi:addiction module HigA family antidote